MLTTSRRTWVDKYCLTLRQWAFLCSLIAFVITAVLTTFAALGKIHTQDVWQLLKQDLAEEEERKQIETYDKKHFISSNEEKLKLSQHFLLMIIWILYICTWIGCLNLSAAILMIYGIATKNSIYIIPWILISGTTYLLSISTILVAYLEMLPGISISFNSLAGSLASSTLFMIIWYTILLYYTSLTTIPCARYPQIPPTIIQAYGGYIHTVNPPFIRENKEVV